MPIKWLNASEVVSFAEEIVGEIEKLFPLDERQARPRNAQKEQKRLNSLLARVRAYALKTPLNIYKKARFLNAVKWKLRDAGHDHVFVRDVVALLATALNG
jgi:formiminotetrahydrofolate cyclodeaminase